MDRLCQQLLAGPALTRDQNGDIASRMELRFPEKANHLLRLCDDRRKGVLVPDLGSAPSFPTEMISRSRLRSMARFSVDTSSSREIGFVR